MAAETIAVIVMFAIILGAWGVGIVHGEYKHHETRMRTHDRQVNNATIAARWRERQMAMDDSRGKHASRE